MSNLFKINGNPEQYEDLDVFHKLAQQFLPYAQQSLGFDKPVGVNLLSDPENVKDPLGKTAYYDPNKMEITLFVDKRHVKDLLRSMAHELVHHTQNCRGEFDGGVKTGPGYAQDDEHMRKMEAEAYLKGSGFLLRDWEDSLKENKTMSKKKLKEEELLYMQPSTPGVQTPESTLDPDMDPQAGRGPIRGGPLERLIHDAAQDALKQGLGVEGVGQVVIDADVDPKRNLRDPSTSDPDTKEMQKLVNKLDLEDRDEDELGVEAEARFEEGLDEGEGALCEDCGKMHEGGCMEETKNENWMKGNKDQLLFERLIEKWIK